MTPVLYPAIDVREGRVVRLRQGDYARETRYREDPLALARRYADAGARWLHLVDLDGARAGRGTATALVQSIVRSTGLSVQAGGGVRAAADVERLLDAGAARVVVGTVAVRSPDLVTGWLRAFGAERVTIALDARSDADGRWRLPVEGWTREGDADLVALARWYADHGLRHLLCTDIARDGMLSGPNIALYRVLVAATPTVALQASGGVRDLGDVVAAGRAGCAGVVLGRALLEGRLPLAALAPAEVAC